MHLLPLDKSNYVGQADPYILKSGGKYYIYGENALYKQKRGYYGTCIHIIFCHCGCYNC